MLSKIRNALSESSTKAAAARGSLWLGGGNAAEQAIRFVRNMILARLLAPEALGVVAIIYSINMAMESLTQVGIREAVIQSGRSQRASYLNGAWWLASGRSLLLTLIGFSIAGPVASFYNIEEHSFLVRLSFLNLLFTGTISVRAFSALKTMNYKKWVLIHQVGSGIGILTTIALALFYQSLWVLIAGYLLESFMKCVLSFVVCPFFPRFSFTKEDWKELLTFSKGMLGLPLLNFIFLRADIFVIGKLSPASLLGLYSFAGGLADIPTLLISVFINPILIPVFSKMKDAPEKISRHLRHFFHNLISFGIPVYLAVAFNSGLILETIYGEAFRAVALPFSLLLGMTSLRLIGAPLAAYYIAMGKPALQRRFVGIRVLLIALFIYPLTLKFSVAGAAASSCLAMALSLGIQFFWSDKSLNLDLSFLLRRILEGLLMALPVFAGKLLGEWFSDHRLIQAAAVLLGLLIATLVNWHFYRKRKSRLSTP